MKLKKSLVGLWLLALITAGLTIYVVSLGIGSRGDAKTESKANEIATALNSYYTDHQKIPESLTAANISDVPSSITYTKKSDSSYEFCMDYKSEKNSDTTNLVNSVTSSAVQRVSGMMTSSAMSDPYSSTYPMPSLYIPVTHKKGSNCLTVTPSAAIPVDASLKTSTNSSGSENLDSSGVQSSSPSSSLQSTYCDPNGQYYSYIKNYCTGSSSSGDVMTQ